MMVDYGLRDKRIYAGVVRKDMMHTVVKDLNHQLVYNIVDKEALKRFTLAYIRRVVTAGSTYNIQDVFDKEGYFGIKATSLGARLILLKDRWGDFKISWKVGLLGWITGFRR